MKKYLNYLITAGIGLLVSILIIFGKDAFLIPSMLLITLLLVLFKGILTKGDKNE